MVTKVVTRLLMILLYLWRIKPYCTILPPEVPKPGKPERAAPKGQGVAPQKDKMKSHHCNNCLKQETVSGEFNICSVCKLVRYCSRNCQKKHWGEHKTLCTAIRNLSVPKEKGLGDSADANVFASHLTPNQRSTIVKLVGEKCNVRCELNGVETEVLWDTEAQVSIIPARLVREKFPNVSVKDIHELLGIGADLKLQATNGTQIPYNGW